MRHRQLCAVAGFVSLGHNGEAHAVQMLRIAIAKRGDRMKNLAFLTLGLLAGCSLHSNADRNAAYQEANQHCMDAKVRTGGSWVSLAECTNSVDEQYDTEPAGPQIRTTRLSLAYKIDHGEISEQQARAELVHLAAEFRREQQRTNAADAASAATTIGAMPRPVPQVHIAQRTPSEETPVTPLSPPIKELSPSPEHGKNHQAHQRHRRNRHQRHGRHRHQRHGRHRHQTHGHHRHQTTHRTHGHGKRE